jgi:TM2 domain-containing membrane protein YozV
MRLDMLDQARIARQLEMCLDRAPVRPDIIAVMSADLKNPGLAAVISALIPGLGQFYNGDFLRGIFWLIVTPGLWIGSGGTLGWICHVVAAITAYSRARKKNASRVLEPR